MPFPQLDAQQIRTSPLADRRSYLDIRAIALDPAAAPPEAGPLTRPIEQVAQRVQQARQRGAAVILAYGAHLIKNGGGPLLRALIQGGWVTHLATQGAGIIHDWEFAWLGRSSESVRDNTPQGQFGSWEETGRWLNLAALAGAAQGLGLGEALGRLVAQEGLTLPEPAALAQAIRAEPQASTTAAQADLLHTMQRFHLRPGRQEVPHPFKQFSVLAASYTQHVPLTVHPGIGYDIITNHPLFHGAALGRGAGIDARIFARSVMDLSGGVYLSIGSAIMSPQIFEKALSLANNVLLQTGQGVHDHDIVVVDLQEGGGWDWSQGEPPKDHPAYYLRFCKTFHRMGGRLTYLCADNRLVLAHLLAHLSGQSPRKSATE